MADIVTFANGPELKTVLETVQLEPAFAVERHLPGAIVEQLASNAMAPKGVALALLIAAKNALVQVYGPEKSMASLEGLALVFNIMPKYIKMLVPENLVEQVISELQPQMPAVLF